jgi:dihydrofolate reductase
MKTILWATLTANGNYQRNDPAYPPCPEALADFAAQVRVTGCFVVGRRTFEAFAAQQPGRAPAAGDALGAPTIVLVSKSPAPPGVLSARSPGEALTLLRERGFSTALLAGGETLHNAFLAEDLVDELTLDVAPVLEDEGFKLRLPKGGHRTLGLLETKALGGGVMQLRYDLRGS